MALRPASARQSLWRPTAQLRITCKRPPKHLIFDARSGKEDTHAETHSDHTGGRLGAKRPRRASVTTAIPTQTRPSGRPEGHRREVSPDSTMRRVGLSAELGAPGN